MKWRIVIVTCCMVLVLLIGVILLVLARPWWWMYASEDERVTDYLHSDTRPPALMIVAHPDDELLFGGGMLLDTRYNWHVVVVTGSSSAARYMLDRFSDHRFREFQDSSRTLGFEGRMWDYEDSPIIYRKYTPECWEALKASVAKLVRERSWVRIVTHNKEGEYGHFQHSMVHHLVTSVLGYGHFEVFDLDTAVVCSDKKRELCRTLYPSQQAAFRRHAEWVQHGNSRRM